MPDPNLAEIALRIASHLKRFESDPALSGGGKARGIRFWSSGCGVRGRFVSVHYVSYEGSSLLTKSDALAYLKKLDEGYVGRHYEALKMAREES